MKLNQFGTFTDNDGIERQCRYVGPVDDEGYEELAKLIYVDYCLDDGTKIEKAIISKGDFRADRCSHGVAFLRCKNMWSPGQGGKV